MRFRVTVSVVTSVAAASSPSKALIRVDLPRLKLPITTRVKGSSFRRRMSASHFVRSAMKDSPRAAEYRPSYLTRFSRSSPASRERSIWSWEYTMRSFHSIVFTSLAPATFRSGRRAFCTARWFLPGCARRFPASSARAASGKTVRIRKIRCP